MTIPAGIDNGQTISLRGQGHAGSNGGPSGDLLITVMVRPHEIFRREGTSVFCEAPITFTQAVLGAELEIPTIDGRVKYTIPRAPRPALCSGCGARASRCLTAGAGATSMSPLPLRRHET